MSKKNGFGADFSTPNQQNVAIAGNEISKRDALKELNLASMEDLYLGLYDLEKVLASKNQSTDHPALTRPESVQTIPTVFVQQLKDLNEMARITVTTTEENGVSSQQVNKDKLQQITNETDPKALAALFNAMETVISLHKLRGETEAEKAHILSQSFSNLENWADQAYLMGFGSRKVELMRQDAADKIQTNVDQIQEYRDAFNLQEEEDRKKMNFLNKAIKAINNLVDEILFPEIEYENGWIKCGDRYVSPYYQVMP